MTSKNNTVLYVGMTNNIERRSLEHKTKFYKGSFSARYNVDKLVYFEEFGSASMALEREQQLKAGPRKKKVLLINSTNPNWTDLFETITSADKKNVDLVITTKQ